VRLQFATEEAEEAKKGGPALHEVTPSSFIVAGLELEDQQYVLFLPCDRRNPLMPFT
jgi:hypothetical protein